MDPEWRDRCRSDRLSFRKRNGKRALISKLAKDKRKKAV